jgi:putative transposase
MMGRMKEWLSAKEIAAEKLPEMPGSESGVIRFAKDKDWDSHPMSRNRQGRGGGMEYSYHLLPVQAQIAYMQKHKVIGGNDPEPSPTAPEPKTNLCDKARTERDARLTILASYDDFLKGFRAKGRAPATALHLFSTKYNNRSLQVAEWVRGVIPSISPRTIMRWRSAAKKGSDKLAVDRSKARKGSGVLETANGGAIKSFILAWVAKNTHLSAQIIRGYCELEFGAEITLQGGELKPLPPLRTFQHFIKQLKTEKHVVLTKITDPDRFRSTMKLSGTGTYRHVSEPNALWMIDASPVDALCLDGRHSLYACIDIATRRLVITLSKTPRASAVALMIRKATLKWGAAKVIKTDNGSDFVAHTIKQLFNALNIDPDVSDAYSPEQKGHVERVIGTFQHEVGPQLPGFIGHSVADRKAIEGRKSFADRLGADEKELFEVALTAEKLQQHIDDWLDYVYHEREHGGLKGQTPNAVARASNTRINRVDERALDVLLMPVAGKDGRRKMTKQGIKIDHFHYLAGSIMVGTDLFVRMDPMDMGKAYVFSGDDGRFLDVALCPELADVNPVEFVKAQQQLAAELIRSHEQPIKADLRALKKGPSGIERTITLAKRKVEARVAQNANVIVLPKRTEEHTTPQIAAALEAFEAPKRRDDVKPLSEKAAQLHEAIKREHELKATSKVIPIDPDAMLSPPARMYKWALSVEAQIASGVTLDDATAGKLTRFQATGDYQSLRDLSKDFGLENALRMF